LQGEAFDRLEWFANYTYLKATFRERITMPSANNPGAVDGEVEVQSGDRLPLVPDRMFKAGVSFEATDSLTIGAGVQHSSKMYLRGDEGNGVEQISGYTVFDLRSEYRFNDHVSVFVTIDNLFDHNYETFGLFGNPQEVLGDEFDDPRFVGPGAPRAAWIGVTLQ
jgi:outer membrane receptor protein involved in Fe transport